MTHNIPRLVAIILTLAGGGCLAPTPKLGPDPRLMQQMQVLGHQAEALQQDPHALEALMGRPQVAEQPTPEGIQVVVQAGHAGRVSTVALSSDGRRILSGGVDETVRVWDVAARQELRVITGIGVYGAGLTVRFDPGAERALIADFTGTRVIDLTRGAELFRTSGVMSDDGRLIARHLVAGVGGTPESRDLSAETWSPQPIVVVEAASGKLLWRSRGSEETEPEALSAAGEHLLLSRRHLDAPTSLEPQRLELWDIRANRLLLQLELPDRPAALRLSPSGRYLAIVEADRQVALYDAERASRLGTLAASPTGGPPAGSVLAFSPDSRLIGVVASVARDPEVTVWSIPTLTRVGQLKASSIAFGQDGRTAVIGQADGGAPSIVDLQSSARTELSAGGSAVQELALAQGGELLVAAMTDGARLWDLSSGAVRGRVDCPSAMRMSSVSTDSAGRLLAAGCADGSAWLWNVKDPGEPQQVSPPEGAAQDKTLVRVSPDGLWLAVARAQEVLLWDIAAARPRRRIALPDGALPMIAGQPNATGDDSRSAASRVMALAISPDGKLIAVGRPNETSLWNAESGERVRVLSATGASPNVQRAGRSDPQAVLEQLRAGSMSGGGTLGVTGFTNPFDAINNLLPDVGAHALLFSPSGRQLVTVGNRKAWSWDVATGQPARLTAHSPGASTDLRAMMQQMSPGWGLAISPDGRFAARGTGRVIRVWDLGTGENVGELVGHTSDVTSLVYLDGGRRLASAGRDGTVRIWDLANRHELVRLVALGQTEYLAVTPDQYYRASRSRLSGVTFRMNGVQYPFEQFDLRFNRPDLVMERLGRADSEVIQSYRRAYEHRLRKLGFTEQMLQGSLHLPEVSLPRGPPPLKVQESTLELTVRSNDDTALLDRLNVYVNDVAVFGSSGVTLRSLAAHQDERTLRVPLVNGRNKIQLSVLNQQGVESLKQTVYTDAQFDSAPADVYIVAIGVSEYLNAAYNLRFAAKDAHDLIDTYQKLTERDGTHGTVHVLELTNTKATRQSIAAAKDWLAQTRPQDLVVIFAAGHGLTDVQQNYYFGTFDIDAAHPELRGLPYEEFEALLDGLPALQKLLLIDTCFSGEIDRDEPLVLSQVETEGAGSVRMRAFKAARQIKVVADTAAPAGSAASASSGLAPDLVHFQQDLFADLRRGTGAVVISSASGNEYALEGEQWRNGVFTYALLSGLKDLKADANHDGLVSVGELQAYVIERVRSLTAGGQNPTVRRDNLDYDFVVY
jgi:WD40 repeat protein